MTAYIDDVQSYGPQGIQQQGRKVEIGEEDCGSEKERAKGSTSQKGKHPSSTCQWCNVTFAPTRGSVGKYCSLQCMHDERAKGAYWLKCSSCLAKIGIGMAVVARMFGTSKQTVLREWRRVGIRSTPPISGGWRLVAASIASKNRKKETSWHSAYMAEYRPCFFDWSSISHSFMQNLRYHRMTANEKRKRNQRIQLRRDERISENPELKHRYWQARERWKKKNRHKVAQYLRNSRKKRSIQDPAFRAKENMRNRFKDLMATAKNGGSKGFSKLIGCSTQQLAKHLESTFKRGMNWGNYGTFWHVDHIIPCAAFDHSDPKQRAQCWHWTNLRALEAKENLSKNAKITEPQMNLLLCSSY
jgi:hypothetical protein